MIANRYESIPGGGRETGFTLIEMLIVMAIIAILTTIALPAYRDYVIRGKIPEATGALATKRVQMEQWFLDNRTYAGADAVGPPSQVCAPDTTTSQYFNFNCVILPPDRYTISAVGKADMAGFTYTIDQNNTKTSAFAPPAPAGWSPHVPDNCWVTKKGGLC